MPLFRSKKVVIEARHFAPSTNPESAADIIEWSDAITGVDTNGENYYVIQTLEGPMTVSEGDYVIKGLVGEFYPCKPDVFHQKYESIFEGECGGDDWERKEEQPEPPTFEEELRALINKHSLEGLSDTPDFVLASFLSNVLTDWNHATRARDDWNKTWPVMAAAEDSEKRQHHNYDSSNLRPHELSDECWCNPTVEKVEGAKK